MDRIRDSDSLGTGSIPVEATMLSYCRMKTVTFIICLLFCDTLFSQDSSVINNILNRPKSKTVHWLCVSPDSIPKNFISMIQRENSSKNINDFISCLGYINSKVDYDSDSTFLSYNDSLLKVFVKTDSIDKRFALYDTMGYDLISGYIDIGIAKYKDILPYHYTYNAVKAIKEFSIYYKGEQVNIPDTVYLDFFDFDFSESFKYFVPFPVRFNESRENYVIKLVSFSQPKGFFDSYVCYYFFERNQYKGRFVLNLGDWNMYNLEEIKDKL